MRTKDKKILKIMLDTLQDAVEINVDHGLETAQVEQLMSIVEISLAELSKEFYSTLGISTEIERH